MCVCVCVCVSVHVRACVHTTLSSHPASSRSGCLFCFVFLLSPPQCRKQTLALSVLPGIFLPFEGIRWVGECCAGMSGPLPEARLLFRLIIEQKSLFVSQPQSQTTTRSSLSFLHAIIHGIHVGWEQRLWFWELLCLLPDTRSLVQRGWADGPHVWLPPTCFCMS